MRGSGGCVRISTSEYCSSLDPPSILYSLWRSKQSRLWSAMRLRKGVHRRDYTSVKTRLKEHKDTYIKGFTDKCAIAEHTWTDDCPIHWGCTRVLQSASRTMELHVISHEGAICIWTAPESLHFNCDGGYNAPDCWITIYKKLGGGACAGCVYPTTS